MQKTPRRNPRPAPPPASCRGPRSPCRKPMPPFAIWTSRPCCRTCRKTLLTGSASVRPLDSLPAAASPGWGLQVQLANALPGPWDQQRLPLEQLDTQGEWRNGAALVRSLKAQLGGGEVLASGEWGPATPAGNPAAAAPAAPAPAWKLNATLKHINPAQLHTQLAPLPLNGRADVSGQGAITRFDASVQAVAGAGKPARRATGPRPGAIPAGTICCSSCACATPGHRQLEPAASGRHAGAVGPAGAHRRRRTERPARSPARRKRRPGQARRSAHRAWTAGSTANCGQTSGGGELSLQGRDAAQALRWLQKLPGHAGCGIERHGQRQRRAAGHLARRLAGPGPAGQAGRAFAGLVVAATAQAPAQAKATTATPATPVASALASPTLLKIRELQATLSGRLSQAQLGAQGRVEIDQRRYALQLAADGGRLKPAGNACAAGPVGLARPAQATEPER